LIREDTKTADIKLKLVTHGSDLYKQTVGLRYEILRKPLGLNFTEEQLAAEDSDFHFALYKNNKLAACLVMTPLESGDIKMRQVAVAENLQGQGMGKKLVKFTEDWSRENGYKKIVLHARQTAVPFYLSQDYEIVDPPFTEVGIPHRKMVKSLV
jgi:predicted GNAT family N-acyltransferase